MRAAGILFVLAAATAAQHEETAPYEAVVGAYRAGETAPAIERLLALGPGVLGDARRLLDLATRGTDTVDARAAAMLHTDAAEALTPINRNLAARHVSAAQGWADSAARAFPAFRPTWYLAAGLLLVEQGWVDGNVQAATDHFDRACREMPDDVPLLSAAGWLSEQKALAPVGWQRYRAHDPEHHDREKRKHLDEARDRVRAALDREPQAVQPALRLGRIALLRGEPAAARLVFEKLLTRHDVSDPAAYLARILLARILEQEQQAPQAMALYREAIARVPGAAAARMGLARLMYASGDTGGAREVLRPVLVDAAAEPIVDPWVEYLNGHIVHGRVLRRLLRAEVLQ
jgi:tetratricopeptide (TPR) repeat protein